MTHAVKNKDQVSVIEILEKEITEMKEYEKALTKRIDGVDVTYRVKKSKGGSDFLAHKETLENELTLLKSERKKVRDRLEIYEKRYNKLQKKYGEEPNNKKIILKQNVVTKANRHKVTIEAYNEEIEKVTNQYKRELIEFNKSAADYEQKRSAAETEAMEKGTEEARDKLESLESARNKQQNKINELWKEIEKLTAIRDKYQEEYNKMAMGEVKKDKEIAAMMA